MNPAGRGNPTPSVRIRLIRKLANHLDGVDVSRAAEGDVLALPLHEAELLVAEGWASLFPKQSAARRARSCSTVRAAASRIVEQVHAVRDAIERSFVDQRENRRLEDVIREELRESRSRTITGGGRTPVD